MSDSDDDTTEDANYGKSDNLFDLIHYEHIKQTNAENVIVEFEAQSYLTSILRPYQINAIKWMLKRESSPKFQIFNPKNNQLHALYQKITNKFNETLYYQRFDGM